MGKTPEKNGNWFQAQKELMKELKKELRNHMRGRKKIEKRN